MQLREVFIGIHSILWDMYRVIEPKRRCNRSKSLGLGLVE